MKIISVSIPREESAKEHQTLTFLMSGKMNSWLVRDWIQDIHQGQRFSREDIILMIQVATEISAVTLNMAVRKSMAQIWQETIH